MLNRSPSLVLLGLLCATSLTFAADGATGCRPPTSDEQAWMDANLIRTVRVLPNRLAIQRATAERLRHGQAALPAARDIAEDGAEIIGSTGTALRAAVPTDASVGAPPRAVDNSPEPWFPPVRSQGSQGSCACFSTTYYTMTSQVARLRGWNVKNSTNTDKFSPRFTYNQINGGGDNGSWITGAYSVMQTMGTPTWQTWPYNQSDYLSWPTAATVWREAIDYRMAESGSINAVDTDTGLTNAKQMLADGYILNYATNIYEWQFTDLKNDAATSADDSVFAAGVPAARRKVCTHLISGNSGHAMTIVGYNDDLWCDLNGNNVVDTGEKGAFRIVNSWGTGWTDGGYAWICYDALKTSSAVSGGPNPSGRQAAFWGAAVYWLKARASYAPTMVAEITTTHAKRDQLYLSVGRGSLAATSPTSSWNPSALQGSGGAFSFDGSNTALAATFVIDCSDLLSAGLQQRWFVRLRDDTTGDSATLTSARLILANGTVANYTGTNPGGGLPKNTDNANLYAFTSNAAPTVATSAHALVSADGLMAALTVVGADDGGEANLTYAWSTSGTPPAAVQFSTQNSNADKNSTATFTRVGTYSLVATITDTFGLSTTSPVTVVVHAVVTTVSTSPAQASVAINTARTLTATARDQFAAPLATQPSCTWSVNGGGTISTSGVFTAGLNTGGPFTATATMASKSATAQITVVNAAPTIATTASAVLSADGKSAVLSVLGADDSGEPTLTYTWTTTGTPPAPVSFSINGNQAAKNATASFITSGDYTLHVTALDLGGLNVESTVTVSVPASAFPRAASAASSDGGGGGGGCGLGSGLTSLLAMAMMALMRLRKR